MASPKTVSVIVPTRNEAKNVGEVLAIAKPYADELIVIDGNSTDGTLEIAKSHGAQIYTDNGRGKGAALRQAASLAKCDIILFIDADWSHNPHDIPALLAPIRNGDADHVTGSRMLGGSDELFSSVSEFVRLVGSEIITLALGKKFGVRITDSQNGFRCMRKEVFSQLDLQEEITTIEQEMVAETLRRGFRLIEVPTHEFRRHSGESSIKVWKVGFRYVYCLIRNLLKSKIRPAPKDIAVLQEKYRIRWNEPLESSHSTSQHITRLKPTQQISPNPPQQNA